MKGNNSHTDTFNAIILSAGKSARFGKDKAFLPFDGGHSFLNHLLNEYSEAGANNITVVIHRAMKEETERQINGMKHCENIRIVVNPNPEKGRFSSIKTALEKNENRLPCFIQNIDNPFTTSLLLRKMIEVLQPETYVIPVCRNKHGHPVLVSPEIMEKLASQPDDANLREFLSAFCNIGIECDDKKILANINSRKDFTNYFKYAPAVIGNLGKP